MRILFLPLSIVLSAFLPACGQNQAGLREPDPTAGLPVLEEAGFRQEFAENRQWPSFRGVYGRGWLDGLDLPPDWNRATGKNILWECALPDWGSPRP
ncbi:MAG: hypothetical protein R2751_16880 [Bacteroidales bacterium]